MLRDAPRGVRLPLAALTYGFALVFVLALYRRYAARSRTLRVALPLVLAGAIGNGIDRLSHGYVVDFVHAHWHNRWHWAVFNVADAALVVGIALMLLAQARDGDGPARVPA